MAPRTPGLRSSLAPFVHLALYRPKYLFVHIPKNGGVSMRLNNELWGKLLKQHQLFIGGRRYTQALFDSSAAAGLEPKSLDQNIGHARWRDYSPWLRQRLQAVSIVRNPWSRTVSRYTFLLHVHKERIEAGEYVPGSFEEFLEERHVYGGVNHLWHRAIRGWYNQLDYVTDEQGAIRADILRTERLSTEAQTYFNLKEPLGKRNHTSGGNPDYRTFYTPKTIQIVADWYKPDIDAFGFDFDTPATRNTVFADGSRHPPG